MRKIVLSLAALGAMAVTAAPASAAVNVSFSTGTTLGNNQVVFQNFDTFAKNQAVDVNSNIYSASIPNKGTQPTGSSGGFLAVGSRGPGSYFLDVPGAAPVLSFLLGTLDTYNSVTLNFVGATSKTYTGTDLYAYSNGADGRYTFDVSSSDTNNFITSVLFESSVAAMEIDDVASAAPEPGTWLMMILGFGLVGAGLRARRRGGKLVTA